MRLARIGSGLPLEIGLGEYVHFPASPSYLTPLGIRVPWKLRAAPEGTIPSGLSQPLSAALSNLFSAKQGRAVFL